MNLLKSLQKHWGYPYFRPWQQEICEYVLSGKDVFAMMSTGAGKSLCYQLPSITKCDQGVMSFSLVVCPLVALMEDQIASLNAIGISAGLVGGASSLANERRALNGEFTVLYITPEKLPFWRNELLEISRKRKLVCIAVDECHCVSEWGNDFRPSYRNLYILREWFPGVPFMSMTATATPDVMRDVIQCLKLDNPLVVRTSLDRPNLHYAVRPRESDHSVVAFVNGFYRKAFSAFEGEHVVPSSLVYTHTRADAEKLAGALASYQTLNELGVRVDYYHAGLPVARRSAVQRAFARDEVHIVVATVAFGMGINKPDIRLVLHSGMPASIEDYFQQTGRAGRDGLQSQCVLFYNRSDVTRMHNLKISSSPGMKSALINSTEQRLKLMDKYCTRNRSVVQCRRKYLLKYFDVGAREGRAEGCCDMCDDALMEERHCASDVGETNGWVVKDSSSGSSILRKAVEPVDVGKEVLLLLRAIVECGQYYAISTPIDLLTGSKDKSLRRIRNYEKLPSYGAGKMHPKDWWKALGNDLCDSGDLLNDVLTRSTGTSSFSFKKCVVTSKGMDFIRTHTNWKQGTPCGVAVSYTVIPSSKFRVFCLTSRPIASKKRAAPVSCTPTAVARSGQTATATAKKSGTLATKFDVKSIAPDGHVNTNLARLQAKKEDNEIYDEFMCTQLESRLRKCRGEISTRLGESVAPYTILSTADMKRLVEYRPISLSDLKRIPGWGEGRVGRFGNDFVSCILVFMEDMGLPVESNMVSLESETNMTNNTSSSGVGTAFKDSCDSSPCKSITSKLIDGSEHEKVNNALPITTAMHQRTPPLKPQNGLTESVISTCVQSQLSGDNSTINSTKCDGRLGDTALGQEYVNESGSYQPPPSAVSGCDSPSFSPILKNPYTVSHSITPTSVQQHQIGDSAAVLSTKALSYPPDAATEHSVDISNKNSPAFAHGVEGGCTPTLKRKRSGSKPPAFVRKSIPGTRLKRSASHPASSTSNTQQCDTGGSSSTSAGVPGSSSSDTQRCTIDHSSSTRSCPVFGPNYNWNDAVINYLQKHNSSSFLDIVIGIVGTDSSAICSHSCRVREAINTLAQDFCIYMDGDKYCTL